ncbi:OTU domain, ubiquitin aldehyde binding [Coelomomyces lativittatus]|nr:OTU domain, ubiquitin aldehyde binding [Coelomomyces lativittatus]KAJ1515880.1 OTU domain, ubiquitin aldehyde binding [Coelomomyces lativittatus]KAJ1516640.1 OTU domain, ubiquitin aldehyde binding [Coelomomyces lativittatus]
MTDLSPPSDEQILTYENEVKEEQAKLSPLVSVLLPIHELKLEYTGNLPFLKKIDRLQHSFSQIRRCRGDGNCFYRAFAYAWFERILMYPDLYVQQAETSLKEAKDLLLNTGFQPLAFEDFLDTAEDTFQLIRDNVMDDPDLLVSRFQNDEISNGIVVLFRFISSAYLQLHKEEYEPFILDGGDMATFCSQYVEAMGRESDQIQIIALSRFFKVNIVVEYLDASGSENANEHYFEGDPSSNENSLYLIYRPGHYDLIYKN